MTAEESLSNAENLLARLEQARTRLEDTDDPDKAIEIRLNAEDPEHDFRPSPGRIEHFRPPEGPGVRVDTFVESGAVIPPYYDSMIAKVIVWDTDRPAAVARAERALRETVVDGVPTTRDLALEVLASEQFRSGDYSTSTLDALRSVAA